MTEYTLISRDDAVRLGLKHFFTGVPCKHGHTDLRSVHPGNACRACAKDARARFAEKVGPSYFTEKSKARCPEKAREIALKARYGVSSGDVEAMLKAQGGCCAICSTQFGSGKQGPHVDHDHDTGAVRGLLCGPCNRGIGLLKDSSVTLLAAAAYLQGHHK